MTVKHPTMTVKPPAQPPSRAQVHGSAAGSPGGTLNGRARDDPAGTGRVTYSVRKGGRAIAVHHYDTEFTVVPGSPVTCPGGYHTHDAATEVDPEASRVELNPSGHTRSRHLDCVFLSALKAPPGRRLGAPADLVDGFDGLSPYRLYRSRTGGFSAYW